MKRLQSIKTLFHTPVKTFLTFLLLAIVMFSLFSRTGEYSITSRETKNVAKEYQGVGSVEIAPVSDTFPSFPTYMYADPRLSQDYIEYLRYKPLSWEQIQSILELPYISSSSTRYMTSGVSDAYYRLDEGKGYYNYTARFIIEGTLSDVEFGKDYGGGNFNDLTLDDCTALAGNIPWSIENKKITVHAYANKEEQGGGTSSSFGDREIVSYDSYIYDTEYIKKLTIGSRYIFIGRYEPMSDSMELYLSDSLTSGWCEAVQSVDGQPENYLETENFAPLRELIELTNSDLHTFDVVYTDNMSSIMRFAQGDMAIINGRELTKADSEKGSEICVVSSDFASGNGLSIGDKIKLKLGTELFEQYKGLGAVAATRERYSSPDKTVELKIVGIYMDTDSKKNQLSKPNWGYSINTVFVPKSLLPLDENKLDNHVFSPSEFSFSVDNAWDIPSFENNLEKAAPLFEENGLKIIFDDDGWPEIANKLKIAKKLSLIAIIVSILAVIAATVFTVYLFIGRKKKEYAIMRALGTSKKESAKNLLLPLMALTISAALVGSFAAWIYTVKTVSENAVFTNMKDYTVDASMPIPVAVGCILGEIIFVFAFASFRLWRIGCTPVLMLLQDTSYKKTYRIKRAYRTKKALQGTGSAPILCYIIKHIRRSVMKSVLSVLLSVLLFVAVGQCETMRQSYIDLCSTTEIKAKFMNGLSISSFTQLMETSYVTDPYYEFTSRADINSSDASCVVTNNIYGYTGEEPAITYAQGYDESCMEEPGSVCIVGNRLLEENGLQPGDKVLITVSGTLKSLQDLYIDKYRKEHHEEALTDAQILEIGSGEIEQELSRQGTYFTIAGSVTTPSGKYDETVFSPGTLKTTLIFGKEIFLELAEFTVADNLRVDEFRSYAKGINSGTFVMDTSKIDNVLKSLALFNKLIPTVLVAAVLIGGLLCGLIIIQSSKETAILRVLGTTRRRTGVILVLEQIFLCMVGLIIGIIGLWLYNGTAAVMEIAEKLCLNVALYFIGCLTGSLICSIVATNRKVLNLLQLKE